MLAFPGLPIQQLKSLLLLLEENQLESGLSGLRAIPEEHPGSSKQSEQDAMWTGLQAGAGLHRKTLVVA